MAHSREKLYRSRLDRVLFGVCGGLANYFDIDSTLIRIIFVLLFLANGIGIIGYFILALIIPEDPREKEAGNRQENAREFVEEVGKKTKEIASEVTGRKAGNSREILGFIVIIVGLFLLVSQFFPMHWIRWNLIWPALLVVAGIYLISKQK